MQSSIPFNKRRKQSGYLTITYALMITGLLGFSGLAVDVGYMQWVKRRAQSAADAAAMGALRELELGHSDSIATAGLYDASLNGFTDGQDGTTVTIYNPPPSGPHAGSPTAVEAVIHRNFPTMFMRIFGQNSVPIAAKAVARTNSVYGSIGGCIFALNKTAQSALKINGTNMNLYSACSAVVESTNSSAFTMGSGAIFYLDNQAHVGVVGGWSLAGQSRLMDYQKNISENPVSIVDPDDPFAKLTQPSLSNIGNTTIRQNSNTNYNKNNKPSATGHFSPGIYCGGVAIGDTDGQYFVFDPGVYVIAGGGLNVNSSAMIQGTGVTFFITSSTGWGCPGNTSYQPVTFNGNSTSQLTAPTSGTFCGILFFEDRSIYDTRNNGILGTSQSYFDGAFYFKHSPLQFAGSSSTNGYTVLVADTISINGNTTLRNHYESLSNPNPFAPYTTGGGLVE
jgi:hypothetical protein